MKDALFISWVGMGLVFVGLLALWGMMAVLVKLTNSRKAASATDESVSSIADKDSDPECKRKAASAAVAVAMALMNTSFTASPHREIERMSPWQAAHRSHQISPTQYLPRRKE